MDSYYINSETLILIPLNLHQTRIIELDRDFVIKKNIMDIVNESCCYFGSNYAGRYQGSKKLLNMAYKLPIIVEDFKEIVIFPTSSARNEDCCWLALNNIENYKKNNKRTFVYFKNKTKVDLDISYGSFESQIFRATMLIAKLKKRIAETN